LISKTKQSELKESTAVGPRTHVEPVNSSRRHLTWISALDTTAVTKVTD